MEDKGSGLSYFLLGIGVGVAVGIIFAPKSGEETRTLLKSKAGEGADYLKQKSGDIKSTATGVIDKGKDLISRQKDTLNEAVEAGKQAYRDAVGETGSGTPGPVTGGTGV